MRRGPHPLRIWVSLFVILSMLLQSGSAIVSSAVAESPPDESRSLAESHPDDDSAPADSAGSPRLLHIVDEGKALDASITYRTTVSLPRAYDWVRLERVGVRVLVKGDDWALVLADEEQLEDLARLRFRPEGTEVLTKLLRMSAVRIRRPVTTAQLAQASSVDDDGDGLTNTQ